MKAVTWHGQRNVRVEQVPDPVIKEPNDAIVRITSTNICGSDLHLYEVLAAFMEPGDILGHEPMGVVEEVGPEAAGHIAPGDRVVVPFNISCGHCWMCDGGCSHSARPPRTGSTAKAHRCSATPTVRRGARRPGGATCACRRPSSGRSRCQRCTGRPLSLPVRHPADRVAGSPSSPTCPKAGASPSSGSDRSASSRHAARRSWVQNACSAWISCPSGWRWAAVTASRPSTPPRSAMCPPSSWSRPRAAGRTA